MANDTDCSTTEDIFAEVDRISAELERIARVLDDHAFRLSDVRDRGACARLQRVAHDTAIGLKRLR